MKIPVYRLPYSDKDVDYVTGRIAKVLKSGYLTDGGPAVKEFEHKWSEYVGSKNSISVNSCTTGLQAVLSCIGISGKSVVVPNYTFYATPMSVINEGGKVVFADISTETLSLTLESIKSSVTADTAAVIIVHVGGIVTDEIFKIKEYCDSHGIFLLEDAACAAGSLANGKYAGTIGHAGVFSFHHSKVLTTGEGGMICTDSTSLAKKLYRARAIGLDRSINNFEVFQQGSNYKMSEVSAVLGILHTEKASEIVSDRRSIAKFYDDNIRYSDLVSSFTMPGGCESSYYKYLVKIQSPEHKDIIRNRMANEFNVSLPPNVYDYNCNKLSFSSHESILNSESEFPNSVYSSNHLLCLNMFNGITLKEREYLVDSLNKVILSL